ncbi:hypothetical protein EY643_16660 [Halioglobus maricola]|uniref:Uncharacterized protein n=1 Tax=Halioglobus maricola TaxID=2601894 RepID=A0A5P9NNT2_9GAMM|nr:hypothetical protein [Halioglobus maricola]QFU77156.1 hypothetical protein EY643_16660 [Halioglobus maricola]
MEQIGIAFTGLVAIWLTQHRDYNYRRYACLFGLAGQPFWFYSAYMAQQWGIFLLCIFYAVAWARGIRTYWLKPVPAASQSPSNANE